MRFLIEFGEQSIYLDHVHIIHLRKTATPPNMYIKCVTGDEYHIEFFSYDALCYVQNAIDKYFADEYDKPYIVIVPQKLRIFDSDFRVIGNNLYDVNKSLNELSKKIGNNHAS